MSALTIEPTINPKLTSTRCRHHADHAAGEPVQAIVVAPKLGVKSMAELIALAKQKPDTLTFASTGQGTATPSAASTSHKPPGSRSSTSPIRIKPGAGRHAGWTRRLLVDAVSGSLAYAAKGELVILATTAQRSQSRRTFRW